MIKYLKSVGVLLFLSTVCNGTVYANQEGRKTDVRVTQQKWYLYRSCKRCYRRNDYRCICGSKRFHEWNHYRD